MAPFQVIQAQKWRRGGGLQCRRRWCWSDVAVDSQLIGSLLIVFLVIFAVQLKKYCFCAILVALFT